VIGDWYRTSWRRNLVDMHVAEWDPRFMADADPERIADTLALDHGTAVHVFANSHTGLAYYPTKVGRMHRGLGGRDLFGLLVNALHARGKSVIAYYSVVYNELFWEDHPESRIVDARGESGRLQVGTPVLARRPCVCCPNSAAYRAFVEAQIREICTRYEFEGFYPDNCFWPTICYCSSCRARYEAEIRGEPPHTIDWEDRQWVQFQRARQRWLAEFAELVTGSAKGAKPGVTVSHQANVWNGDWLLGPSQQMLGSTDWLAADAGGDRGELSYVARLFLGASRLKPFEMIRAWYHGAITDHTVAWTEERLRCAAFAAFIHGGARTFIDAIDPVGTLNPDNHERAGRIYRELETFEPWGGGESCADVAVYVSFDSFVSLSEKGMNAAAMGYNFDPARPAPEPEHHRNAAIAMCRILLEHHLLFDVITARNLHELHRYQLVVLPNALMLRPEEMEAIRGYVAAGGSLYASRHASLLPVEGGPRGDFLLADVFGVHYRGETAETHTYAAPVADDPRFRPFTGRYPITCRGAQCLVEPEPDAEILATITLPYTDPSGSRYASMLSNPPGIPTVYPALVKHGFGKGNVLYASGIFERWDSDTQRNVLAKLLVAMLPRGPLLTTNAPKAVELTLFQREGNLVLHVLNFQAQLPNIPVDGIEVGFLADAWPGGTAVQVRDGGRLPTEPCGGRRVVRLSQLDTYEMIVFQRKRF
jgi:hypothetical protein